MADTASAFLSNFLISSVRGGGSSAHRCQHAGSNRSRRLRLRRGDVHGYALPHLKNTKQLIQAAVQMRTKLRSKGLLVASIRDYDRLIEEKPAAQGPSFYSDEGQRRIVFQVWDWIDDRRYVFHLYLSLIHI